MRQAAASGLAPLRPPPPYTAAVWDEDALANAKREPPVGVAPGLPTAHSRVFYLKTSRLQERLVVKLR
ncbi:unnamed protein product [Urochloa humidicola]